MKRNALLLLTALSLVSGLAVQAANIAWVGFHAGDTNPSTPAFNMGFTNAPDVGYTALLAANGHTVTRFLRTNEIGGDPTLIAALNTNQLVIISRSIGSGDFDSETERAAWHTSVTVPLMSLNGYIDRNNRLGFHTGDTIPDINTTNIRLRVTAPTHPIFAGIALDATNLMVNPYSKLMTFTSAVTGLSTNQRGMSVVTSPVISGGSTLATVGTVGDAAFGGAVVAEFPPGTVSSRTNTMANRRLIFITGSREGSTTGTPADSAGVFDLLTDGAQLFLNAVNYLTTPQSPKCTMPLIGATNLVAGDAWTFTAGPIGDPPLSYQWYQNGSPKPGETSATLVFTNLATSDGGEYYLVVSNPSSSGTSTTARLEFAVPGPASITNSLISYWPLDTVLGTKTPDLVSGYDMTLIKMGTTNLSCGGKYGECLLIR